ncbi:hypothetical protein OF83DRAFT_1286538 [Amylostereum chailletii]|nr:hypothetical protein OF83DRAFT_1286538 [Amylostereum chailletii]
MPLASSGAWSSFGRQAARFASQPPNISSRGIHISSFLPRTPQSSSSTAHHLLRQTRNALQAFVGHLTAPSTLKPHSGAARSLHALTRGQTIQNGLSFPVRNALSRPLGAPKLPRAPAVPPSVFQVGLGTARNFTTGRPIFQHLAENVPVAGRAFCEVDINTSVMEEKQRMRKMMKAEKKQAKKAKATKIEFHPAASTSIPTSAPSTTDFDHYFSEPSLPKVTTTLLIPLAPTPSSRLPLSSVPSSSHPLLPFAEMSALHYDHIKHHDRVAVLFERLDKAKVWDHNTRCDVYGDARGGANTLRVTFEGWEANAVRAVIGETGTGWCVLEEDRELDDSELEDAMSQLSGGTATPPDFGMHIDIDPSQSFVLPTLDFSSSFHAHTSTDHVPSSSASEWDAFSDSGSLSDGSGSWIEPPDVLIASRTSSWFGFSSSFTERMKDGPREELF